VIDVNDQAVNTNQTGGLIKFFDDIGQTTPLTNLSLNERGLLRSTEVPLAATIIGRPNIPLGSMNPDLKINTQRFAMGQNEKFTIVNLDPAAQLKSLAGDRKSVV